VRVTLVAAVGRGGVIGLRGGLPWPPIREDMARFRSLTMGHPVVMGRRTWDSLPDRVRPLPGRRNVVVTRNPAWEGDGAERAGSLEEALALLDGEEAVFVVGGGEIYAAALPVADVLELTEIDADVPADTFFPPFDRGVFVETRRVAGANEGGPPYSFVTYERRTLDPEP
jgi:dihydrofolate reductase